jgi:hypothetical protein
MVETVLPARIPVEFSVLAGEKLGAGFVIGASPVAILLWAVVVGALVVAVRAGG